MCTVSIGDASEAEHFAQLVTPGRCVPDRLGDADSLGRITGSGFWLAFGSRILAARSISSMPQPCWHMAYGFPRECGSGRRSGGIYGDAGTALCPSAGSSITCSGGEALGAGTGQAVRTQRVGIVSLGSIGPR